MPNPPPVSGSSPPTPTPNRRSGSAGGAKKGSTFVPEHGTRRTKLYVVTDAELSNLFGLGMFSALFFSLAIEAFKFPVDVYKDLSINAIANPEKLLLWQDIQSYCLWAAATFAILMIVFVLLGNHKIAKIKKETIF